MKYLFTAVAVLFALPVYADELSPIKKWEGRVAREEFTIPEQPFKGDLKATLDQIHERWKIVKWTSDEEAWEKEDYWASRKEFLANGKGDCDEFATAYYFDALEKGISNAEVWVVMDKKRHMVHAITTVGSWVLDNQSKEVVTRTSVMGRYQYLYEVDINGYGITASGEAFIMGIMK